MIDLLVGSSELTTESLVGCTDVELRTLVGQIANRPQRRGRRRGVEAANGAYLAALEEQ